MTYAGLTITDKPALLDAKARGAEWVARDTNNDLYGYAVEPIDDIDYGWTTPFIGNVITINAESMKFVALHEKINIDLALAQIAEMESKTETILGYPIEHLQKIAAIMQTTHITPEQVRECADNFTLCVTLTMNALKEHMDKSMTEHIENQQALYSPYTEGETK